LIHLEIDLSDVLENHAQISFKLTVNLMIAIHSDEDEDDSLFVSHNL